MSSHSRRAPQSPPSFYTQPMRPVRHQPASPVPRNFRPVASVPANVRPGSVPQAPARPAAYAQPRRQPNAKKTRWWLIAAVGAMVTFALVACLIVTLGAFVIYGSGNILPGVQAAGVNIGNLSREEAVTTLQAAWTGRGIVLQDGARAYPVDPAMLGITLDAEATVRAAYQLGRSSGGLPAALRALTGTAQVEPVVTFDQNAALAGLQELAQRVSIPAVNAGVQMLNGQVTERAAADGRALDMGATITRLGQNPTRELADGDIDLVMHTVQPAITDAGQLVAAASALLASPLDVRAWDPVDDHTVTWSAPPELWSQWLTAEADASAPLGLRLSLDPHGLQNYLTERQTDLGAGRFIQPDDAVQAVSASVAAGQTNAVVRIYHEDRQHTVQPGETIISIAWDYGVPYPYIQQANPTIGDTLSAGQVLTVPSPDVFMNYPPVYGKRVVVSISQQRVWVYENGGLKWEWIASTGIQSSPTWPGIYQILSHEPNAYAGNWDLWMPNFLGVYRPIPGSDFTNGFHGFPTRGGSQLLWTNSLGTRVTYGCILLSDENVQQLYAWAEEGVIVEIQA